MDPRKEGVYSWCEACGDVPWSADELRRFRLQNIGEHLTLCNECRQQLRECLPAGVPFGAMLEELYEHRCRAPKRHVTLAAAAAGRSLYRGRRR
jgi:hypothetical protein